MDFILESFAGAWTLLAGRDPELLAIVRLSVLVSGSAVMASGLAGLPLAFALVYGRMPGRGALRIVFDTLMSLPSVAAGLLLYSLLCRKGLLGGWGLLYTPWAMGAGQFVLATPIAVSMAAAYLDGADPRILRTAATLGSTRLGAMLAVARETRAGLACVLLAAFGRVFAEVGASMILGGNIRHHTRNIPTAMAAKISDGEFSSALALGLILLAVAFSLSLAGRRLGAGGRRAL
ncbi:MAG: ABC transporter permease [Elusimicrobia bacterium]|nr:ABC transporter permease [Elusimicrobiota bacterium]